MHYYTLVIRIINRIMICYAVCIGSHNPFPTPWKWAVSRILFWLPLLENRGCQFEQFRNQNSHLLIIVRRHSGSRRRNFGRNDLNFWLESLKIFSGKKTFFRKMLASGRGGGRSTGFFFETKTSQIFQTLVWDNGGLKIPFQTFCDLNFSENSLINI
jgi:hypothetical protein